MDYSVLVDSYEALASTSKRLEKTKIISELLKTCSDDDLEPLIMLVQGKVFPEWDDHKIGVSHSYVIKAMSKVSGVSEDKIKEEWKTIGDLGQVAENLMQNKGQATLFSTKLTIFEVLKDIKKLATEEGSGSMDRKTGIISNLLTNSDGKEAKYLVRMVLEDLRVGVSSGTLRDSIVWAYLYEVSEVVEDREEYNKIIKITDSAYHKCNDFAKIARLAKKGIEELKKVELKHGQAIKAMLAQKEKTVSDAFDKVGRPANLEYKLDGFRMQIHKQGDSIHLFTRRLDDVTKQFPDVVRAVKENVKGDCVLDSEAVGYDKKTGKYLVFQHISQRIRRKYGIKEMAEKLPVELNVFDIISYDNKSTIDLPLTSRMALIDDIITQEKKKIVVVTRLITSNEDEAKEFFDKSIKEGNEGLMFKKLSAPYSPGSRVGTMVKLKSAQDPLDLVVVGGEWGTGKRSGWITSLVLACYDPGSGEFLEIGKVGTGLKEKQEEGLTFEEVTEQLKDVIISEEGREIIISPKIVLEIECEEIQKSPTYSSGFALRFPRVKLLRTDRRPEDCTTIHQIEQIYVEQ